jgi:hypothetical protein
LIAWGEGDLVIDYSYFCYIWKKCLSYVKIREYKACSGKCQWCPVLSTKRSEFRDLPRREIITQLFAIHRVMYMGERVAYMDRIKEARTYPNSTISMIGDGMQQSHSTIPW